MRYRWWIASSLLICGLIGVSTLYLWNDPPKNEAVLTDGTIVRFEQVGMGTMGFDSFSPVKAAIAGFVPNRFQSRLGERLKGTISTGQPNTIGILFSMWTSDGRRLQNVSRFLSRTEFVDSTGFIYRRECSGYNSASNMICIGEGAFPRRDRTLHLRCYEVDTERLLFDLHVPNPGYQPVDSEWIPEVVPASHASAPLTVTLKHDFRVFARNYLSDEDLDVTSADPDWTNARLQRNFWLSDVTGNRVYQLTGLSPFEPAWKLTVQIRRDAAANFQPDEVWRTKLLSLPGALRATRLDLQKTIKGVTISAAYVSSAGAARDDSESVTVTEPHPHIQGSGVSTESGVNNGRPFSTIHSSRAFIPVKFSTLDDDTQLILTIRDQTGAKISLENGSSYGATAGTMMRILQFEPRAETTEIELEVIVNPARTFEFLVAPPPPK